MLLGAVGGPKWETLPPDEQPERGKEERRPPSRHRRSRGVFHARRRKRRTRWGPRRHRGVRAVATGETLVGITFVDNALVQIAGGARAAGVIGS